MAQTTDGYLWLGTSNGLYRFDGARFEKVVPEDGQFLPSEIIVSLLAVPDGGLWIGNGRNGVSLFKSGHLTNFSRAEGITVRTAYGIVRDRDGAIWAAGGPDGLYQFDGSKWHAVQEDWNFAGDAWSALVDSSGTLWIGSTHGVYFLLKGAKKFQLLSPLPLAVVNLVTDGVLMGEDLQGTVKLVATSCQQRLPSLSVKAATEVRLDSHGSLWMGSWQAGINHVAHLNLCNAADIEPESFTEVNSLSGSHVERLLEDREGNMWVATNKGLDSFRPSAIVSVPFPTGLTSFTLTPLEKGAVFVTAQWSGTLQINDGKVSDFSPAHVGYAATYRDPDGVLWLGSLGENTLRRVSNNQTTVLPAPGAVFSIIGDPAGGLLTQLLAKGFSHFDNGSWTSRPELGHTASSLFKDSEGRIWFGFADGKVTMLSGATRSSYADDNGPRIGAVLSIQQGHDEHVWMGGEKGLAIFDGSRFASVAPADLSSFSNIAGMVATKDNGLWFSEARGIVHIDEDERRAIEKSPSHRAHYRVFDAEDGLLAPLRPYFPGPTAIESTDGLLWFATADRVVWIDPNHIPVNLLPPPVLIRSVTADNVALDPSAPVIVPAGTKSLQIDYTALSFTNPRKVRFKYSLVGFDSAWTDAGTRRQAFFTELSPRNYEFRVIASNNDGVWNEVGATIKFKVRPMFYQTSGFVILCVVCAAVIVWLLYLLRIKQVTREMHSRLEERMEARIEERGRIARELHDSLLQGFQGLMFRLQAVRQLLPDRASDAAVDLDAALDKGDQAITEARGAVQGLRLPGISANDLTQALTAITEELASSFAGSSPPMRISTDGVPRPINAMVRGEVYAIARECLRNAVKHAHAENIVARLSYGATVFILQVHDDGVGIDPGVLQRGMRPDHFGLPGMRERASRIGGRLLIRSVLRQGTEVELSIPGRIAYSNGIV